MGSPCAYGAQLGKPGCSATESGGQHRIPGFRGAAIQATCYPPIFHSVQNPQCPDFVSLLESLSAFPVVFFSEKWKTRQCEDAGKGEKAGSARCILFSY